MKKKKAPTKLQSERMHVKKRFSERFGLSVNRHLLRDFISQIQSQKAIFVERQSLRLTVWEISYENNWYRVIYDNKRKTLVTVLPKQEDETIDQ